MSDENITTACDLPPYAEAYQKARKNAVRRIYAEVQEAIDEGYGTYLPGSHLQWVLPLKAEELPEGYKQVPFVDTFEISWETEPCTATDNHSK